MNTQQEEKELTESLIKGLRGKEFQLYLQFIVDNKTKKIVSAEALSRWHSPEKGIILPGCYIQKMEMTGLIREHDFYMFEQVCRQLAAWHGTPYSHISISCNFTRITLSEDSFVENLKKIMENYVFDKARLAIEITEDAMEENREMATKNMSLCKEMGIRVYLDDLGSGYTSLANLCDYPIDVVKIDRDILLKTNTPRGKKLFCGIIALAHSLDIHVLCEGVETAEQEKLVSETECDFIQGWYYAKPLPVEEKDAFLERFGQ